MIANLHKKNTSDGLLYPTLSYKVQGCFYTVYNTLGFGHKEVAYQRALVEELISQRVPYIREKNLPILYNKKKIADIVKKNHSYTTPCINFLPAEIGNAEFGKWLEKETKDK